jgi:hypothetical protein
MSNAGTYPITVTATLSNYPYSAPSLCQSSFTLTVIDSCISTSLSIVPASIENLAAFAGYTVSSKVKYAFNDTVSTINTLTTDRKDFCGEKQLTF